MNAKPRRRTELKYLQIADIIARRIEQGEYPDGSLGGLRTLAAEFGVNYLTVRRSLHHLCGLNVLHACGNRRFEIQGSSRAHPSGGKYAMILPMGALDFCLNNTVAQAVSHLDGSLRKYYYSYYEDEIVAATIDGDFDAVFFMIDPARTPKVIVDKIVENRARLISLAFDYTGHGLRMIAEASIRDSVEMLVGKYLAPHAERVDILGIGHENEILGERIDGAERFARTRGIKHMCVRRSVPEFSFEFEIASELAREVYGGGLSPGAIFVPTVYAGMAVMRILKDLGHTAGRDYSIASCEDLAFARYCIPSLTVTYTPRDVEAVAAFIKEWRPAGDLTCRPSAPSVFVGESTIAAGSKKKGAAS